MLGPGGHAFHVKHFLEILVISMCPSKIQSRLGSLFPWDCGLEGSSKKACIRFIFLGTLKHFNECTVSNPKDLAAAHQKIQDTLAARAGCTWIFTPPCPTKTDQIRGFASRIDGILLSFQSVGRCCQMLVLVDVRRYHNLLIQTTAVSKLPTT